MPASAARSRMTNEVGSSHCSPKVMVPRHNLETGKPVRPRFTCSIRRLYLFPPLPGGPAWCSSRLKCGQGLYALVVTCVRAPGSSANLGPGFDVLGVAFSRYAWASDQPGGDSCGPSHIARVAYEAAGGDGDIWFGFDIEPGRGLGFSGAARAAGAVLAKIQQGHDLAEAQRLAYPVVADIEGHGDNAAPSVFGGMHVIAGDCQHRIQAPLPGQLLCWVPELETATDDSRLELPAFVDRADAVFNLGRVGLLVAAMYEGDLSLLRQATQDRLHQPYRLSQCAPARRALEAALDHGAAAAWLSGSGPAIAIIVEADKTGAVVDALPAEGKVLHLDVDDKGSVVLDL
jgi:homoserine kinase